MRDKQIEEMRYLADKMGEAISNEYKRRVLADERKLEAVLIENGWRKASDVAREIFAEIDRMCIDTFGNFNHRVFAELKKEYTEDCDGQTD